MSKPGLLGKEGPKLTASQEVEYGEARAGKREWVRAGVAAYELGITTDALKQRRARGGVPKASYQEARSAKEGTLYRWTWVVSEAGTDSPTLKQVHKEHAELSARLHAQEELIAQLLSLLRDSGGITGLLQDREWSVDAKQRLRGLTGLAEEGAGVRTMSWLDAMDQPWAHLRELEPYALAADQFLDVVRDAARKSAATSRDILSHG